MSFEAEATYVEEPSTPVEGQAVATDVRGDDRMLVLLDTWRRLDAAELSDALGSEMDVIEDFKDAHMQDMSDGVETQLTQYIRKIGSLLRMNHESPDGETQVKIDAMMKRRVIPILRDVMQHSTRAQSHRGGFDKVPGRASAHQVLRRSQDREAVAQTINQRLSRTSEYQDMLRLQQAIESGEARGPDAELQFARLTQENIKRQIYLWTEANKESGGAYAIQIQKLTRARAENEQLLLRIESEVYGHGGVNKVAVKQSLPGSRRMIGAPKGQFAEAEGSIDWLIQSVGIWATKSGDRSSLKTIGALFPNVIQSLKGVVSDRTIARMVKLWASVPEGERTGKSQRTLAHEMSKVAFRMRNDLTDAKERAQSGLRLRGGAGGEESKQEEVDDPGEAEFHMRRAQEAKEYFGGSGRIEDSSFQKDIQNVFSGPRGEPFERSKKNLVEWVGKLKQSPHVNQGAVAESSIVRGWKRRS